MPEDFRSPLLKFEGAKTHIQDLYTLLRRFMEVQTYKAVANFDLQPGNITWIVRGEERFDHNEFSPIVGDAIHNLRDSLDLAVSVLMRNSGLSDKHIMFPTADSAKAFQEAIGGGSKKPRFPSKVLTVLETRIQPYIGGDGYWLRTLHNLAIADKHRMAVPIIFGVRAVNMRAAGRTLPIQFIPEPATIKDGSKLAILNASDFPNIQVNEEASLTLSVEFDKRSGALNGWPIHDGLIRLQNVTEGALDALKTCL